MNEALEVYLWGTRIGVASRTSESPVVSFAYDRDFIRMGVEPSPLMMPIGESVYAFPELPSATFHGLPGLLSDSVPDKFGNAVIDIWLRSVGRTPGSLTPIERLAYTGTRGMGALEFRPTLFKEGDVDEQLHVERLSELAAEVLKLRTSAGTVISSEADKYAPILRVGSSAGGARAKALIGWNRETGEVRSGQVKLPPSFEYWMIKFDGIDGNGDKEADDARGFGRVEYSYYLMAKAAGIEMAECRLWNARHFMTRRFDRTSSGDKLHMLTLGGMAHFDFNDPLSYSYEQAFRVTRRVTADVRAEEQLCRRMVFNVFAWNCDDHVKNIAYLMDRNGSWRLSPAYDLGYAYNPEGSWTARHQMSINGKREGITDEDMISCAASGGLAPAKAKAIIDEVRSVTTAYPQFAELAQVREDFIQLITKQIINSAQ